MYKIRPSVKFKRDLKTVLKRGLDVNLLEIVVDLLVKGVTLPPKYRDHALTGKYGDFRECHIASDWLLIYRLEKNELILYLFRTGTHSDLF